MSANHQHIAPKKSKVGGIAAAACEKMRKRHRKNEKLAKISISRAWAKNAEGRRKTAAWQTALGSSAAKSGIASYRRARAAHHERKIMAKTWRVYLRAEKAGEAVESALITASEYGVAAEKSKREYRDLYSEHLMSKAAAANGIDAQAWRAAAQRSGEWHMS